MMNAYGDIRWRLDYGTHPDLKNADYQDEISQLRTGNFFFGDSGPRRYRYMRWIC